MGIDMDFSWLMEEQRVFRFGYFEKEKLKEIKLLVCLINGHICVSGKQKEVIPNDVKDTIGVSLLKKSGVEARLISERACSKQTLSVLRWTTIVSDKYHWMSGGKDGPVLERSGLSLCVLCGSSYPIRITRRKSPQMSIGEWTSPKLQTRVSHCRSLGQ